MAETLVLHNETELYDDIFPQEGFKRNLRGEVPYFAVGTDGAFSGSRPKRRPRNFIGSDGTGILENGFFNLGFMPGNRGKKSRYREYKDWLKKYPWINGSEVPELWKVPVYIGLERLLKGINKPVEERGNVLEDIICATLDAWTARVGKYSRERIVREAFPRISIEMDMGKGAAIIDKMYTVVYKGFELPVYFQKPDSDIPGDDELRKNVDYVLQNDESPYNDSTKEVVFDKASEDKVGTFYDPNFSKLAAAKLTRLDFAGRESSRAEEELMQLIFRRYFARDQTWFMKQFGEQDYYKDIVASDGNTYRIKSYNMPTKLKNWLGFKITDKVYDYTRTFLDPVLDGLEALGFSEISMAQIISSIYKNSISPAVRGLTNIRTPELRYSVKGAYN